MKETHSIASPYKIRFKLQFWHGITSGYLNNFNFSYLKEIIYLIRFFLVFHSKKLEYTKMSTNTTKTFRIQAVRETNRRQLILNITRKTVYRTDTNDTEDITGIHSASSVKLNKVVINVNGQHPDGVTLSPQRSGTLKVSMDQQGPSSDTSGANNNEEDDKSTLAIFRANIQSSNRSDNCIATSDTRSDNTTDSEASSECSSVYYGRPRFTLQGIHFFIHIFQNFLTF